MTSVDGTGTEDVTVTITGTNDDPVISGDTSGGVIEDGNGVASGTLTITDADTGESIFQAQTGSTGSYGTFSIDANGAWSYTLDNTNSTVQALA